MKPQKNRSKNCECITEESTSVWESIALLLTGSILLWLLESVHIQTSSISSNNISSIFFIGLVASSTSCMAMVGGLILAISQSTSQRNESSARALVLFHAGRIIGYLLGGAILGFIGSRLSLSITTTGITSILVAFVLLWIGLKMLGYNSLQSCGLPKFPAIFTKLLRHRSSTFILGVLTFFVPCGFTQSTQLLALASGSPVKGAMIMTTFALGTLPSLVGISWFGSWINSTKGKYFLKITGAFVIVIALQGLLNGLTLLGVAPPLLVEYSGGKSRNVTIDPLGRQIVNVTVTSKGYSPKVMTIDPHRETWINAYAKEIPSGCASILTAPSYNLSTPINAGNNWLGPIKDPQKDFLITCSMGMLKASIHIAKPTS